jgi:hypothetical protein
MSDLDLIESQMHPGPLYREETFTDRKTATIRVLTPVTEDGAFDGTRAVVYQGDTQLLTNSGVLPLVFDLEARSLPDALAKFASAARAAVERALKELEELRREAASSLIVADRMPGPLPDLRGPRR